LFSELLLLFAKNRDFPTVSKLTNASAVVAFYLFPFLVFLMFFGGQILEKIGFADFMLPLQQE